MKNYGTIMLVAAIAIVLTGCATTKEFAATGGSRSDGTVKLSYEYGEFEKPVVDLQQGVRLAQEKCAVWGYSGAQAFGAAEQTCVVSNAYGCIRWRVTAEYQCLGSPKP
jgi:YecR-like lipoprotein